MLRVILIGLVMSLAICSQAVNTVNCAYSFAFQKHVMSVTSGVGYNVKLDGKVAPTKYAIDNTRFASNFSGMNLTIYQGDNVVSIDVLKDSEKLSTGCKKLTINKKTVIMSRADDTDMGNVYIFIYQFKANKHNVEVSCVSFTKTCPKLFVDVVTSIAGGK